MARSVSGTFIREYRKQFLQSNGNPKVGFEKIANTLLDCMKLAQEGRSSDAVILAKIELRLDLDKLYKIYRDVISAHRRKQREIH